MKPGDLVKLSSVVNYTYTQHSNGSTDQKLHNTPGLTMLLLGPGDGPLQRCKVLLPDGKVTLVPTIHLEVVQ
jgi:hypothetical protein